MLNCPYDNLLDSTILLLKDNKKFHSFGYEAQNVFYDLNTSQSRKWYYFEHFKMILHNEMVSSVP